MADGAWFWVVVPDCLQDLQENPIYVLSDSPVLIAHLVTYRLMPDIVES